MEELELLVELHIDNPRQGPGSSEQTLDAIELSGLKHNENLQIADLGCGSGASTLILAKELDGHISAVDLFPDFLSKLKDRAKEISVIDKITTLVASLDKLEFAQGQFDLIWSEGAIYNMGFEKGVNYWKQFLKPEGVLAVTEITWLTEDRPKKIQDYWENVYPEIATPSEKVKILEEAGYDLLAYFPLPENCWEDNYYQPLQKSLPEFAGRHKNSELAKGIIETEKEEIALYASYKEYYSYGFYIARKQ